MIVPADKSDRKPPTFPAPRRTAPSRITPHALAIREFLRSLRSTGTRDRSVDGVVVVSDITVDSGTTFFHLTDEARAALRDGLSLPWGT